MKSIGVFTGTRAEYGLLHPIIQRIQHDPDLTLHLLVSGAHLDEQFGKTLNEIEQDGIPVAAVLPLPDMGHNMAIGCGALCQEAAQYFAKNPLDCLLVLGDRYETLGVATAALLSNVAVAHSHGGDVVRGGMLDEPIRHAITKMAHLHFPATQTSADRILAMGEEPWRVHVAGSPALDTIKQMTPLSKADLAERYQLDPSKPWILFTQHPITTQSELAGEQARQTLDALAEWGDEVEIMATYPNHDKGSLAIIDLLEGEYRKKPGFHIEKSLGRVNYLSFIPQTTLVVGNSSSGLLETAHFKVPCINVGLRQEGRERGHNVVDVPQDQNAIAAELRRILSDAAYRESLQRAENPFGEGRCAEIVVSVLKQTAHDSHLLAKQLTY